MIEHIAIAVLVLVVLYQFVLLRRSHRERRDQFRDLSMLIEPGMIIARERTLSEGWGKAIAGEYAEVIYRSRDGTIEVVRTQD